MSTYWDVHCMTCDKGLGLHGNHQDEAASLIARDAEKLATVGELIPNAKIDLETYGFYTESGRLEAKWFADHKGHDIQARNEYGGIFGRCQEWFPCATCKRHRHCDLSVGHVGDHDESRQ